MVLVDSCMFKMYRKVISVKFMMVDVNLDEEELSPTQSYPNQVAVAGWYSIFDLGWTEPPHSRLLLGEGLPGFAIPN